MSDFLREYLERRRDTVRSNDDSAETAELLSSLNSNIGLVANSTSTNEKTSKRILGTIESQVALERQRDVVYSQFSKEQIVSFQIFADEQKSQTHTLSKGLLELNRTLSQELGKKLEEIAKYLKPDNTHSKRKSEAEAIAERAGLRNKDNAKKPDSKPKRSLVEDALDLFDFEGDDKKKGKGKGGRGRGRPGKLGSARSVGSAGSSAAKTGGWWDAIKGKIGGAGESVGEAASGAGKGLKNVFKSGGAVAGKLLAPVGAAIDVGMGVNDLLDGKRQTEMPSGWDMLSPMRWGMYGGEKINQGYEAAGALVGSGNMIEDGINGVKAIGSVGSRAGSAVGDLASSVGKSVSTSFNNSIIPGFSAVTSNFGRFTESFETSIVSMLTGLSKTFSDFGDDFKGGARAVWAGAKQGAAAVAEAPAKAVKAAVGTAKVVDEKTGNWARKGLDAVRGESGGLAKGKFTEEEQAAIAQARSKDEKFRGGGGLTESTKKTISETAQKYGVDEKYAHTMAQIESGGNSNAVSATGAVGTYQFTSGTAKQYGLKNRFDEKENIDAGMRFAVDNKKALEKAGIEATPANLYLAHQQGAGGAVQILKGKVSDDVRGNMAKNYGDMSPEEYVKKNNAVWASKEKQAEKTTYAGTYNTFDKNGKPVEVASSKQAIQPSNASGTAAASSFGPAISTETKLAKKEATAVGSPSKKKELDKDYAEAYAEMKALSGRTTDDYGNDVKTTRQSIKVASAEPEIKTTRKEPQRMVDQSSPVESTPVAVTNTEQMSPKVEVTTPQPVVSSASQSTVPTLDGIPLQITDLGLVLLNIGHV